MTAQQPVSHRDSLDIVFANRNRAYGAYQLRRQYPEALGRALALGLLLIALGILAPRLWGAMSGILPEAQKVSDEYILDNVLVEIPPPPPVVATPPPPPTPAVAFPPPMVAPDETVPEDTKPLDVETVLNDPRDVGGQTVAGDEDLPPSLGPSGNDLNAIVEPPKPPEDQIFDMGGVNKSPSFPGGDAEMFKWIYKHIVYPTMARDNGISGSVVLNFVVGKDGNITSVEVLKEPAGGGSLSKEAIRVVKSMPRWTPGEANGHPVKVRFTLPVKFKLQ